MKELGWILAGVFFFCFLISALGWLNANKLAREALRFANPDEPRNEPDDVMDFIGSEHLQFPRR